MQYIISLFLYHAVCSRSLVAIAGSNPAGGEGCLSLAGIVCCQVEISSLGWLLVQRSSTECGVSIECDCEASIMRRPWSTRGCCALEIHIYIYIYISRDKWAPVTTARHGWRNGFPYGGQLRIYWIIRSREQPTRGGPPTWELGEVLTNPHRKNVSCYKMFTQKASDLDWYFGDRWQALVNTVTNLRVP